MPNNVPTQNFAHRKPEHVHPRLVRNLLANDFFPMTVSIEALLDTPGNRTPAGGFKSPSGWTAVDGLQNIPARRGVPQSAQRQANEQTVDWGRIERDEYVIVLAGYYPTIKPSMRVTTSDGQILDLRGVLSDSAGDITTITGRIVTPGTEGRV